MSDQKILHIALITNNSEILLTDPLQEKAAYAARDLCKEKGWGLGSANIRTQAAHFELFVPEDTKNADVLSAITNSVSESLLKNDPELKAHTNGRLWSQKPVVIENAKGDTEYPKDLESRIQQAIAFAYPGTHPSMK